MNGYFKLIIKEYGTFLRIFPETEGGERVTAAEISKYMTKEKITTFDVREINGAISKLKDEPVDILVSSDTIIPVTESFCNSVRG